MIKAAKPTGKAIAGKRGKGDKESEELKKTHDDGCYVGQGHCG